MKQSPEAHFTIYELVIKILLKIVFALNQMAYILTRSQCCTCHDSWAVVACAKLWPHLTIIFHVRVTCNLTRFRLWALKHFVKQSNCLCPQPAVIKTLIMDQLLLLWWLNYTLVMHQVVDYMLISTNYKLHMTQINPLISGDAINITDTITCGVLTTDWSRLILTCWLHWFVYYQYVLICYRR